jgi:hypothetical protein
VDVIFVQARMRIVRIIVCTDGIIDVMIIMTMMIIAIIVIVVVSIVKHIIAQNVKSIIVVNV